MGGVADKFGLFFFDERIVGRIVGRVENRLHERVPVVDWLGVRLSARLGRAISVRRRRRIVFAGEVGGQAGDHLAGELLERAVGTPADVRGQDDAGAHGRWRRRRQRLMVEHVECGGNIALLQSGKQPHRIR